MNVVSIDLGRITDWDSFHDVFSEALGFPAFYGRNMDAWIDCMTDVDDIGAGMSTVTVDRGTVLTLQLEGIDTFASQHPELYAALIECSAFVNWRRMETGESAVLALSYHRRS
jgi:Barstar (barnase inhibitor)